MYIITAINKKKWAVTKLELFKTSKKAGNLWQGGRQRKDRTRLLAVSLCVFPFSFLSFTVNDVKPWDPLRGVLQVSATKPVSLSRHEFMQQMQERYLRKVEVVRLPSADTATNEASIIPAQQTWASRSEKRLPGVRSLMAGSIV